MKVVKPIAPMKAKKITPHTHPFLKLGKAPAKRDRRNFKLAALLKPKVLPTPPQWDFESV